MKKIRVTLDGRTLEVSEKYFELELQNRGWERVDDVKARKPKAAPEPEE